LRQTDVVSPGRYGDLPDRCRRPGTTASVSRRLRRTDAVSPGRYGGFPIDDKYGQWRSGRESCSPRSTASATDPSNLLQNVASPIRKLPDGEFPATKVAEIREGRFGSRHFRNLEKTRSARPFVPWSVYMVEAVGQAVEWTGGDGVGGCGGRTTSRPVDTATFSIVVVDRGRRRRRQSIRRPFSIVVVDAVDDKRGRWRSGRELCRPGSMASAMDPSNMLQKFASPDRSYRVIDGRCRGGCGVKDTVSLRGSIRLPFDRCRRRR